jgi:hypothetical protein
MDWDFFSASRWRGGSFRSHGRSSRQGRMSTPSGSAPLLVSVTPEQRGCGLHGRAICAAAVHCRRHRRGRWRALASGIRRRRQPALAGSGYNGSRQRRGARQSDNDGVSASAGGADRTPHSRRCDSGHGGFCARGACRCGPMAPGSRCHSRILGADPAGRGYRSSGPRSGSHAARAGRGFLMGKRGRANRTPVGGGPACPWRISGRH